MTIVAALLIGFVWLSVRAWMSRRRRTDYRDDIPERYGFRPRKAPTSRFARFIASAGFHDNTWRRSGVRRDPIIAGRRSVICRPVQSNVVQPSSTFRKPQDARRVAGARQCVGIVEHATEGDAPGGGANKSATTGQWGNHSREALRPIGARSNAAPVLNGEINELPSIDTNG
jgi:hypothetical protein